MDIDTRRGQACVQESAFVCQLWSDLRGERRACGPMVVCAVSKADAVIIAGETARNCGIRWAIIVAEEEALTRFATAPEQSLLRLDRQTPMSQLGSWFSDDVLNCFRNLGARLEGAFKDRAQPQRNQSF